MGRSVRSKIGKRLRTAKRQRIDAMVIGPRTQEKHDSCVRVAEGRSVRLSKAPNAFKYPDAEGAVFAQHEVMKPIDFRAQNLPAAGYAFRGNRKKYEGAEKEYMERLIKTSHPQMEVMAGGGAILAKTGARVSMKEAELITTAAWRPDVAAIAASAPSSSASAVAAAVAEESAGSLWETMDAQPAPRAEPTNEADTSRRPVVKDTRRQKRTADHKARPNSIKKKGKKKTDA